MAWSISMVWMPSHSFHAYPWPKYPPYTSLIPPLFDVRIMAQSAWTMWTPSRSTGTRYSGWCPHHPHFHIFHPHSDVYRPNHDLDFSQVKDQIKEVEELREEHNELYNEITRYQSVTSRKKVSVSVSKNLVSLKKFRYRYQKIWSRKKSLGLSIGKNFGLVTQCQVSSNSDISWCFEEEKGGNICKKRRKQLKCLL